MLTATKLRSVLAYDAETGEFHWLIKRNGIKRKRAGYRSKPGYVVIRIDGEAYLAHRLAWLYMTGEWPTAEIDHANGTPGDDRWANLRAATRSRNSANTRRRRDNTTGFKGVCRLKNGRYTATICANKQQKHLGCFDTPEQAHQAYIAAARAAFGTFARAA